MTAHHHIHVDEAHGGRGRPHRPHHRDEAGDHGPRPERGRGMGFGPGFGSGRMPFMGRSRSTRRGEIRTAILALLVESPMHGYQIITELSERSGGDWRPSAGSVYPTLQQLTDEGLVGDEERDGRRVYELTETGRVEAAKSAGATPPWQSADKDGSPDLRRVAVQVM
ncbi:MAG: PadR family transcriptional regulator [Chloroflexi bacterium]|nr:PadR family transcriptional regulator [Chloroflexota bacterium]